MTALLSLATFRAAGQQYVPQFRFHFAFEDATGQRDTVWFVSDSLGDAYSIDSLLGEKEITLSPSNFEVYIWFWIDYPDSSGIGKTLAKKARPGSNGISSNIYAQNETYPIKLSWDTSLFANNGLFEPIIRATMENEYFFFYNNCPACHHMFNMMYQDTVTLHSFNWGSQTQFPIWSILDNDALGLGIGEPESRIEEGGLVVHPNPAVDLLHVSMEYQGFGYRLVDLSGRTAKAGVSGHEPIRIDDLRSGMYLFQLISDEGSVLRTRKVHILNK